MKQTKLYWLSLLFIFFYSLPGTALTIKADPRIELTSLVFYLAGAKEYSSCRIPSYIQKVNYKFAPYKQHPIIPFIWDLRKKQGISFDAVMDAAICIQSIDKIEPVLNLDTEFSQVDKRWTKESLLKFYELLADFSAKSDFKQFYTENMGLYTEAEKAITALLTKTNFQSWFNKSFPGENSSFVLIPAFINGPSCYGPGISIGGKNISFCILGVGIVNEKEEPKFDDSYIETIFHEFCHSHTNPIVEQHFSLFEKPITKLSEIAKDRFAKQGYSTPESVAFETMVRACTGAFLKETYPQKIYDDYIKEQEKRSFFWIKDVSEEILTLRKENESIKNGIKKIAKVIENWAQNSEKLVAEINSKKASLDAKRPKVVKIFPENNSLNVSPSINKIIIEFSEPMKNSWSLVGGGEPFPEISGKLSYDSTGKILTVPVKLKPNHEYYMWINSDRFQGFASQNNLAVKPFKYGFFTGE